MRNLIHKALLTSLLLTTLAAHAEKPTLVVLIGVDQLRPDRVHAGLRGGLGRMMRQGYHFTSATLDHALTSTCPGHVVMSTGLNPGRAGIAGNSYIHPVTLESRYCVDDGDVEETVLGLDGLIRTPRAITGTTLGDWLKQISPESRVYAVSGKDRAAITMAGHNADGVYWFNQEVGGFTTSRYYEPGLPPYVASFNGQDFFTDGFGGTLPVVWEHAAGTLRQDDYPGERTFKESTSGHPLNQSRGDSRAENFYYSPFLDEATSALALQMIQAEKLGQRGVTDLLAISYSATDTVGHTYGPYSAESEDTLMRLDKMIGELRDHLDEVVGEGSYVVSLSADHGVLPLPEWLDDQDELKCPVESGRINLVPLILKLYWQTFSKFTIPVGNPASLVGLSTSSIVVSRQRAEELGVTVDEVVEALEGFLESEPGIAEAWTRKEIETGQTEMARLYRNSMVPGKSGDLYLQIEETCLAWQYDGGTTNGSPYPYDRNVPLMFFGAGVGTGSSDAKAHSIDMAPTLADMLGIKAPAGLDGRILELAPVLQN